MKSLINITAYTFIATTVVSLWQHNFGLTIFTYQIFGISFISFYTMNRLIRKPAIINKPTQKYLTLLCGLLLLIVVSGFCLLYFTTKTTISLSSALDQLTKRFIVFSLNIIILSILIHF